jgi:hypothetical protein
MSSPTKRNSALIAGIFIGLQTPIENGLEMPTATKISRLIVEYGDIGRPARN